MRRVTLCLALLALVGGCGDDDGGAGSSADSGTDAAPAACDPATQPAPRSSCIVELCGNEKSVGMTCSEGGGECNHNGFDNAFLCTLDFEPTADLNICTRACVTDEDCGAGAVCTGDPSGGAAGRGCVPAGCVGDDDEDAGVSADAGGIMDGGGEESDGGMDGG